MVFVHCSAHTCERHQHAKWGFQASFLEGQTCDQNIADFNLWEKSQCGDSKVFTPSETLLFGFFSPRQSKWSHLNKTVVVYFPSTTDSKMPNLCHGCFFSATKWNYYALLSWKNSNLDHQIFTSLCKELDSNYQRKMGSEAPCRR